MKKFLDRFANDGNVCANDVIGKCMWRGGFGMKRNAFAMKLKAGYEEEYRRRHDEIWPELSRVLSEAGVADYSIYLDRETLPLFAFQKLSDPNTADDLPNQPVVKKWWAYMADIMETNPDNSPVAIPLSEVFHMD